MRVKTPFAPVRTAQKDGSPAGIYYTMTNLLKTRKVSQDNIATVATLYADLIVPMRKTDVFHTAMKRDILRIIIIGCWRVGKIDFTDIISTIAMLPQLKEIMQMHPENIIDNTQPAWAFDDITDEILGHLDYPQPARPAPKQPENINVGEGI